MLDERESVPASALRIAQVICGALMAGTVGFLGIALFLRAQGVFQGGQPQPILSYVALMFSTGTLLASGLVPKSVISSARRQIARGTWHPQGRSAQDLPTTDAGQLFAVYQQAMIVQCALYEGTAFFWIIVYLTEGNPWALLGAGLFLAGIALQFPTRPRVERWLTEQQEKLEDDRRSVEP